MLWQASKVIGYKIAATDGDIGSVSDLLFDERQWHLRWAVIDTGDWLPGREVLLPPARLGQPDNQAERLAVDLTKTQIEASPEIVTDLPVSRREESRIYSHYGWDPYWESGMMGPAGLAVPPFQPPLYAAEPMPGTPPEDDSDPNLQSVHDVTGYNVHASDGDIGHIEDFLIGDVDWAIRYLVVDTRNWWPGKKVLIAPQWASDISWSENKVAIAMTKQQIKDSPEYDPAKMIDRGYEESLYRHYQRPPYWP